MNSAEDDNGGTIESRTKLALVNGSAVELV